MPRKHKQLVVALGYGWWANSSFVHYDRVYGRLSLLITTPLWICLSAIVVLSGAHLAASIQRQLDALQAYGTRSGYHDIKH